MGHVPHDWALAEKERLMRKAWEALPAGGAPIVSGSILDGERRRNAFGLLMSLNMLVETPGGFDVTAADCIGWMRGVGFGRAYAPPGRTGLDGRRDQVACPVGPMPGAPVTPSAPAPRRA